MYRTHHISNTTTSNHGSNEPECRRLAFNTKSFHWVVQNQAQPNCFVCLWNSRESVKNASDCQDLRKAGKTRSGLYKVNLISHEKVESHRVVCDMQHTDGGWTVFQQRLDGKLVFWNRTWEEFRTGFGEKRLNSEFWLGNELIHRLSTNHPSVNLKVQLWGDRNPYSTKYTNDYLESDYTDFWVGNESTSYTFNAVTQWPNNGNASGGWFDITCASGVKFSTVDRINDPLKTCVHDYHLGGWWLHYCTFSALNGEYDPPIGWADGYGMMWLANGIYIINPTKTRLMLRKNEFNNEQNNIDSPYYFYYIAGVLLQPRIAQPARLQPPDLSVPEQVHLSLAEQPDSMTITWATPLPLAAAAAVEYAREKKIWTSKP
uniref:Fibrinogen C-terminal domain-containing protein n=1 Tax=Ditylenchus dipsaci TaxID=166011 RepID=A0A915CX27_9BILA